MKSIILILFNALLASIWAIRVNSTPLDYYLTSEQMGSSGTFDGDLLTCSWVDDSLSMNFYITLSLSTASPRSQLDGAKYLVVGKKQICMLYKIYDTIVYNYKYDSRGSWESLYFPIDSISDYGSDNTSPPTPTDTTDTTDT
ncbi:5667_t:CDS:2 [Dentiscutata heterogama]|uniref:5667_t:CDS:1 n=1 Tax=Dentiscutata heterogama TaxID=1316150 RepID=A0ACA9LB62_9GLOM|nr:5667_t:CDS:2 [Dentiscutata heterogama]